MIKRRYLIIGIIIFSIGLIVTSIGLFLFFYTVEEQAIAGFHSDGGYRLIPEYEPFEYQPYREDSYFYINLGSMVLCLGVLLLLNLKFGKESENEAEVTANQNIKRFNRRRGKLEDMKLKPLINKPVIFSLVLICISLLAINALSLYYLIPDVEYIILFEIYEDGRYSAITLSHLFWAIGFWIIAVCLYLLTKKTGSLTKEQKIVTRIGIVIFLIGLILNSTSDIYEIVFLKPNGFPWTYFFLSFYRIFLFLGLVLVFWIIGNRISKVFSIIIIALFTIKFIIDWVLNNYIISYDYLADISGYMELIENANIYYRITGLLYRLFLVLGVYILYIRTDGYARIPLLWKKEDQNG